MPLGISERKIERVYGPLDLSGVYKPLIATAQKIAADESKRVDEAKKQLATTSAELNKLRVGVREADLSDITRMYNRWAEVERQLANNPNLIRRNPDVYGELKSESNTLYGNMLGVINESKQQNKIELDYLKMLSDPNNRNQFKENSLQVFKTNVLQTPVSTLRNSPYNDITNYYETIIDGSKFYDALSPLMKSSTLPKYSFDLPEKDKFGQVIKANVENMPSDGLMKANIVNTLKGKFGRRSDVFASQQLTNMIQDGSYDLIKNQYNSFWNNKRNLEFGLTNATKQIDLDSQPLNSTEAFANIKAAQEFINRLPINIEKSRPEFESKAAEFQFRQNLKDISERGAKAEANKGFLDAYRSIKERLARFPGGVSLDKYDINTQGIVIDMVRGAGLDANNRDIYLKENKDTGEVDLLTMREFSYTDDNKNKVVVYRKNQRIGGLGESGLNLFANKSLGMGAKKEAVGGASGGTLRPPRKMN